MLKIEKIDAGTTSLTFDGYRTCYVVRDIKTALVDCGYPADYPGLLEGLDRLGLDPGGIDYLALTHIHLDHAGGAGYLTRMNPKLVVCVHDRGGRHLVDPTKLLQGAACVYGKEFNAMGNMLPVSEENVRIIDSGDTIDLGAIRLNVHHTPGHAKHHVVFHDLSGGSVFAGDALGVRLAQRPGFILTPPGGYDKDASVSDINLIQTLKPERINFAHCGTHRLNYGEGFFEGLKLAHEQWTRCVAGILDENPEMETQTIWNVFLTQHPDLRRYPDQHFSFYLSVRGIREYLERKERHAWILSTGGGNMILKQVNDNRKIFRDMGMNKWRETQMTDLKKGMRIRIYSPNGRPLEAGGEETFLTLSDAFMKSGQWVVEVKAT